jgi:hypothetical protein
MAEKSSWDQANRRQKHGSVWRNRKKISQIIKAYFYLPFFLLIILCLILSVSVFLNFFSFCSLYTLQCHVSILCFSPVYISLLLRGTAQLLIHLTSLSYLQDDKLGFSYSYIFVRKLAKICQEFLHLISTKVLMVYPPVPRRLFITALQ